MHKLLSRSVLLCILGFAGHANAEILAVIVTPSHSIQQMDNNELALIFWRKKLYWAGGKPIHAVNYAANNALRLQFSQSILGSEPNAQNDYWNSLYFHGTFPPHVVTSQEAMLRFVADTPGAIGYIDACKIDNRVKAIAWINPDGALSPHPPELNCP